MPPAINAEALSGQPRCILGIDPGLNRTGYAILERTTRQPKLREGGVLRPDPKLPLAERILDLGRSLKEIIAEFQPQVLAIEQVFSVSRFPKTAILMAHARGALMFAAADQGIPVAHYTPTQIKRLLTGSGHASKEQIQLAIQQELKLEAVLEPNDVADAFAVALCHYHCDRSARLLI